MKKSYSHEIRERILLYSSYPSSSVVRFFGKTTEEEDEEERERLGFLQKLSSISSAIDCFVRPGVA